MHLKLNTQISVIIRGYHIAMVFFRPQSQRDLAIRQGQDKSAVIQDMEDGEDAVVETKE